MQLKDKKFFLLDMDGTIYLDNDLFDGTLEFLSTVKNKGGKYLFVTNNSSKSTEAYVNKLCKIGINAEADDFLTSTDATIIFLKENYPNKHFYVCGTQTFTKQLLESGISVTLEIDDRIDGIILSNDQELTFKKLEDICRLLKKDNMIYIATNPDWVCPTAFGYVPDCGSFADIIRRATNKMPRFIGKPNPEMLLLAIEKYGYSKEESLMIGDRLYTDIACGVNAGITSIFVLSGEGTEEDIKTSDAKPTFVFKNIKEILNTIKG